MYVRAVFLAVFSVLMLAGTQSFAAVQELHVGDTLARVNLLKPGVHRYTRYKITPDGHRDTIDVWSREISFEFRGGRNLLHIHQQWDEISPPAVLIQDSWFDADTMRPLTHVKNLTIDGKTTVGGYRFLPDKIVGMDDLADNVRKGLVQASPEPAYNWETDIEFLQALPLADGYAANINFYEPGLDPPARHTYSVTGSGKMTAPDGSDIDCWIVSFESKTTHARYWFAKKTQVLMHEESVLADGTVYVKTLLNPESRDKT